MHHEERRNGLQNDAHERHDPRNDEVLLRLHDRALRNGNAPVRYVLRSAIRHVLYDGVV